MKSEMPPYNQELPEAVLEQAAIWQARVRDADPATQHGQTVRASFQAWLQEDEAHRRAFAEMERLWDTLDAPVASLMADRMAPAKATVTPLKESSAPSTPSPVAVRKAGSLARWAAAASLFLAVCVGIGWQQDWPTRWQADYVTAVGEQQRIETQDGSTITLNTHSALAMDYTPEERRVRLLRGEAWFEVAPNTHRPFVVDTGNGQVTVTGTRFNVRLDQQQAVVSLDEGSVVLTADPASAGPVRLAAGQQATLSGMGISKPRAFDRTQVTGWTRGQFVFYNAPLSAVVETLNRYHPGHIAIRGEALGNLTVSGVFSTKEPDQALSTITHTLGVQQTRLADYLILLQ